MIAVLAGAATWIAAEYHLHRFVGHGRGNNAFAVEHRRHHAVGDYFAPTSKKAKHVAPIMFAIAAVASAIFGVRTGLPYALGLALMYVGYELLHRRMHTHAPINALGRRLRRHHFHHHFHEPAKNHGVTTSLFDAIFRTRTPPRSPIRVPEKLAMRWLLDPATGEVRAEHRADYVLGRREAQSDCRPREMTST